MLKKIRSLVSNSNPSFIGIYDNALSKKECGMLISQFEKSPQSKGCQVNAVTGNLEIDTSLKQSMEIKSPDLSDNSIISNIIRPNLISCIKKYRSEFSATGHISQWRYDDRCTFKKYETEDDGYKGWHTEAASIFTSKRMLVWMFYLNNAKSGTEFMNYSVVKGKEGRCIIWPSGWTHVHRSELPNKGIKYIVSGWCSLC
jgi:uncharacterized protein YbdZ (MbtH family)